MNTIKKSWRACWSLFQIRVAESLQYRAAALASGSISIFWALIEITVYAIFYRYGSASGSFGELSLAQLASYIWLGQALFPLQLMSIDGEILTKITSGDVGVELCRPLDLYFHWFSKTAAGRLGGFWWRAVITVVAGVMMPAPYRLAGPVSVPALLLFLLSTASAFLLCIAYGMLVTAVRLGITWGEGPTYILLLVGGVLSGAYLPLQLWPDFLQPFLLLQPFAGYLDLPVRLYVGSMPATQAVTAISLQLGWTVLFIFIGRRLMQTKLKSIIVQGG